MKRFKVLGKCWRIKLLSNKKFKKKHGKGVLAVCQGWKRTIEVSKAGLDVETITHELVHAYLYETGAKQTIESEDGLEEFICELFSRRALEVHKLGRCLYRQLRSYLSSL